MSTALYRRYRPETFEQVVGQEHVTVPLMAALEGDRTNHAYLFSGPRGCGKTTSARILARCLNCAEGPTATPCGECESCIELSRGGTGSLDVVEMDAASHGGVDDARELRERASFAPLRDRYKVFIIDEAHMVSNQGFNALLKLVEEPPPHVKFIFATTEPEKVIGTIRSRTHHYPFRLVPPGILEDYLADLASQEEVDVAEGVLPLVVRAGTGSVRDSLSVLDQLIGGAPSNTLDYQTAVSLLGYTDGALLDAAVEAIAAIDGAALFGAVANVVESGHDPRRFVEDLLERLRDLVVIALVGESSRDVLSTVPEDQFDRMVAQAERLTAQRASKCADLANSALSEMVGATSPRLQLELLCARLLLAATTPTGGAAAPAQSAGLADARAAALSFKKPAKPETSQADKPAPLTPARVVPAAQQIPEAAPHAPGRVVPAAEAPPGQQPGRLVPPAAEPAPAQQKPSAPAAEPSKPAAPASTAAPESAPAPQEPEMSDEEKLNTLRGIWTPAMADQRVPRGTSDFIRSHQGKVSVVDGVLRFDFPTKSSADAFVSEKRSTGLQTVFGEMLKKPLTVDVGVFGQTRAGRESSDDAEGDLPSEVAESAASSSQNYARGPVNAPTAPPAAPPQPAAMARPQSAQSPAPASPMSPAQAAIARATARSAERRNSAPSPDFAGGPSGAPAGPGWDDMVPPDDDHYPADDEYGPHDSVPPAAAEPVRSAQPQSESIPKGLPSDLPDIVMDDFPAPPPAAMPTFLAPPPREAPSSATPARDEGRSGSFARLAQGRGVEETAPEPVLDVESEHELVSQDDPLALEARGVGLDVVLDILQAKVVEEVVEES